MCAVYSVTLVVSNSLQPHGLKSARLLCPWDFHGKSTGVHCHAPLQGILPTQGSNPCLLHGRQVLYCWATREAFRVIKTSKVGFSPSWLPSSVICKAHGVIPLLFPWLILLKNQTHVFPHLVKSYSHHRLWKCKIQEKELSGEEEPGCCQLHSTPKQQKGAVLLLCVLCLVTQLCPILCNPMDCSLQGSSVHGDSPGKNTGVGCHALLQGIFPTQGSHCRWILYCLSHQGRLRSLKCHLLPVGSLPYSFKYLPAHIIFVCTVRRIKSKYLFTQHVA